MTDKAKKDYAEAYLDPDKAPEHVPPQAWRQIAGLMNRINALAIVLDQYDLYYEICKEANELQGE